MNILANSLTGLSLLCGFVSIIFSLESHFTFSSWAILLSVIFDGLDGQVARCNPIPNAFGKELDALVDVVSFGIAPSILGYIFVYRHFHLFATCALFIYLVCSIIRLARFNITPKEKMTNYFYGMPTTASGGILASFILMYRTHTQLPPPSIFLVLVILLAFLMVSRVRYLNLDGLRLLLGKAMLSVLIILLAIGVFTPAITIFLLFLIYLIFSPFIVKIVNSK